MKHKHKLNYNQNWNTIFEVNESSPSGLTRIRNKHGIQIEAVNTGTKKFGKNGEPKSWTIEFKNHQYVIHRIIWVLLNEKIDDNLVIDHIDGNPFNNKISNLRLVDISTNQRNRRKHISNTTGTTGVKLDDKGCGSFYYVAYWNTVDNLQKCKAFSVKKFGEIEALSLAIKYREEQIQKLLIAGINYTERHGK